MVLDAIRNYNRMNSNRFSQGVLKVRKPME